MHQLTAPLLTDLQFDQYMENIAESNKLILHEPENEDAKHFFRSIDFVIGQKLKGVQMVVTKLPIVYEGENIDSLCEVMRYQITILKAVGESGEVAIQEALQVCRKITKQILSKLQYDSDPIRGASGMMFYHFKVQQATTDILDEPALTDGWVGTSTTVGIGNMTNFPYNSNDWN